MTGFDQPAGWFPRHRVVRLLCLLALTGIVSAGCSVQAQSQPVRINLPETTSGDGGSTPGSGGVVTEQVVVYLVKDARLFAVFRQVPFGSGVDGVLTALERSPSDLEAFNGVRTALPPGATRLRAQVRDGIAVLSVPESFNGLGAVDQILAVGQLVYTVTAIDGVDGLQVIEHGRAVDIPVDNGRLVSRPVTREDYSAIAPR